MYITYDWAHSNIYPIIIINLYNEIKLYINYKNQIIRRSIHL